MTDGGRDLGERAKNGTSALVLASAGDVEQLVRACGSLFMVTDRSGDIAPRGARELGLFFKDTRHLSHYALHVKNGHAVRLSSETAAAGYNQVDLMLAGLESGQFLDDPKNFLHIRRRQMLDAALIEQITFTNFLRRSVTLHVTLAFAVDFADIFEVRGAHRAKRGVMGSPRIEGSAVDLTYKGLDGVQYATRIAFTTPPADLSHDKATFEVHVAPGEETTLEMSVSPMRETLTRATPSTMFRRRAERLEDDAELFRETSTSIVCDNGRLQQACDQSLRDLHSLRMRMGANTIVAAGIPWFCAPFGRDAIIASYESLCMNSELAVETLRALAAHQGTRFDNVTEEEPGKIFHELRFGEMAQAGEIPHSPYYGSIDATPLYVILMDAMYLVTAERPILQELQHALLAALAWIDTRSEQGTRFVTYERKGPKGLENQGWKDSRAGVSFPNGQHAEPPIALCEVQGYCADAYLRGARLLTALGDHDRAKVYAERAASMRALISRDFWLDDLRRFAFAIDGRGRHVNTIVSNIGHLLWSRVATRDQAEATARLLLAAPSFSGFGIRTLAEGQPVYNPLSYHNGTVWPHDNALIARGLCNYNLSDQALRVFDGLYSALGYFRDYRLPELFCGISRRTGPLVRYPVACSPQAWSAAAPFLLLQATLGINADAPHGRLAIKNPRLPKYLRVVDIRRMRIGSSTVSMRFRRVGERCHVDRLDVSGSPLKTEIEID